MHEPNNDGERNRRYRRLITAAHRRTLVALLLSVAIVLAGCTGLGGLGGGNDTDSGDETAIGTADAGGGDSTSVATGGTGDSDGADGGGAGDGGAGDGDTGDDGGGSSDGSDQGDSGNSNGEVIVPLAENEATIEPWFNLSTPGRYAFDIETAEEGVGSMVFETSAGSDGQATVDVQYELGEESFASSVTGPIGAVEGQLAATPAFAYVFLLSLSGIGPAASLGGQDLEVGNQIQRNSGEGTYSVAVTDTRNYGGVECYFIETKTNGTLTNEVCTQGAFQSAPYVATYNETGLQQRIELTEYDQG